MSDKTIATRVFEAAQETLADLTRQTGYNCYNCNNTTQRLQSNLQQDKHKHNSLVLQELVWQKLRQSCRETHYKKARAWLVVWIFSAIFNKSKAAADAATALTGTGAGTGAGSIESYKSLSTTGY